MAVNDLTKHGKILAEWNIPEYIKYERSIAWYVVVIGLGGFFFIHALVTANFLFAIILFLIGSVIFIHERRHPEMIEFLILETGIVFGNKFYPYKELTSFWIVYEPPTVKLLYFGLPKAMRKELPIHLENQNPVDIRRILLDYLSEDLDNESEATEEALGRLFKI